ncbi:DND1 protein, partial [Atractosteus spatula]|nr:DND1 protein [Atractosteus spatula]
MICFPIFQESCLSIFVNKKSLASLESWKESQGVSLVQVNGQRIYGSPPAGWRGPAPSHSCEVFISNIPRDVFEDKLVPLFEKVGQLYEFRLMMNFSGQNRGFAFAKYREPRGARAAVLWLHRYELPGGCRLAVVKSVEKRRLLIGGLPRALAGSQLQGALRHLAEGVASVTVPPGPAESETAFAVAEYVSHRAASMAKKVVCEGTSLPPSRQLSEQYSALPSATNGRFSE